MYEPDEVGNDILALVLAAAVVTAHVHLLPRADLKIVVEEETIVTFEPLLLKWPSTLR